jgi:hypothetical protein
VTGLDDLRYLAVQVDADQLSGDVLAAVEVLGEAGAGPPCLLGQIDPRASGVAQRTDQHGCEHRRLD